MTPLDFALHPVWSRVCARRQTLPPLLAVIMGADSETEARRLAVDGTIQRAGDPLAITAVCAAFSGVWCVSEDARQYVINRVESQLERDP